MFSTLLRSCNFQVLSTHPEKGLGYPSSVLRLGRTRLLTPRCSLGHHGMLSSSGSKSVSPLELAGACVHWHVLCTQSIFSPLPVFEGPSTMVCCSQGTLDCLVQTIKVGLRFGEWSLIVKIRKHFFIFYGQDFNLFCVAC